MFDFMITKFGRSSMLIQVEIEQWGQVHGEKIAIYPVDRVPHSCRVCQSHERRAACTPAFTASINQAQRKNWRTASLKNEKVINAKGGTGWTAKSSDGNSEQEREGERERVKCREETLVRNPENPTTKATSHGIWTWTRLSKNFSPH